MCDKVEDAEVLEVVAVDVDEVEVELVDGAALRTRNPGLDNSPLFISYVEDVFLKRNTYLALIAKFLSGIAIVHA